MHVWLITVGEPLAAFGDRPLRTGILAETLRERGHDVTWWTSDVDHYRRTRFATDKAVIRSDSGVQIRFLHGVGYGRSLSVRRWVNHVQIARAFARQARNADRPDVVLSSLPTLELSRAATEYGLSSSVPVVIDIRDLWPDEFYKRMPTLLRGVGGVLLRRLESHARYALSGAQAITATSARYLAWGLEKAGRAQESGDRVFSHGYPDVEVTQDARGSALRQMEKMGVRREAKIFWFVGSLGGSIDLPSVIDAARHLARDREIQFVISGTGPGAQRLQEDTSDLANVVWTGWVNQAGIAAMSSVATAGLAPYRKGALMGLPNKIFEYMKFGLPIVVGLEGESRDLVVGREVGLPYLPGDGRSLAAAVRQIAGDQELTIRLGGNSKAVFDREFKASVVYPKMAEFLEGMVSKQQSP